MTFEIEVDGTARTRHGRARPVAGRFRVTVDGVAATGRRRARRRVRPVAAASTATSGDVSRERRSSRPAPARGELLVVRSTAGPSRSIVNGRRAASRRRRRGGTRDGGQPIVAPMPGRVVRVLVAAGDEVAARQAVVVVEAMKMENELRSPKAGRVKDVAVTPGTSVEAGRVLVVIE